MTTRTWLITGASRGLGRALALAVADSGDRVHATVRRPGTAPGHERVTEHVLDVRSRAAAFATVRDVVADGGTLDVVVNNAGHGLVGVVEEIEEAAAREILDTDLFGALWLTQAALPVMRAQRWGHLVQISTVGGIGAMPTFGLYNAAKWALEGMSEALAGEVSPLGIRVSIIEPGGIDTAWATGSMRFAAPNPAYDPLRERLFGTPEVPWPATGTGGGTPPADVAAAILAHVDDPSDRRLRVLLGDDAAPAAAAALTQRLDDYHRDPRFTAAFRTIGNTAGDPPHRRDGD